MKPVSSMFLLSTVFVTIFLTNSTSQLLVGMQVAKTPAANANRAAETSQKKDEGATIKGTVEYDPNFLKSWHGADLKIPLPEIKTKLYQQVELPPVPVPKDWKDLKPEAQQAWAKAFEESEAGKAFLANQEKLIAAAKDYDVLIEKDGKFVVYDVPPGLYGLRGLVYKELNGTEFGFELFAKIEVAKDLNEIRLPPLQVAVTPRLKSSEAAPPIDVETHSGKNSITFETEAFKDKYLLVSFWITNSPSAEYQTKIQEAFGKVKDKYPIALLSICVDDKPEDAVKFILEKELRLGSHGFTGGFGHPTMLNYGVRAIPSFWLISPDRKIAMSQYEFALAFRQKNDLSQIIMDRIEGKDVPTPADTPTPAGQTPAGQTPAGQTPAGQTPAGQTPAGQTPAGQTPETSTPK